MVLTELFARLGLTVDAASFAKGQLAVDGIRGALTLVADAARKATLAIAGSVERVIEQADAFDVASQKTGINVEALQELTYAAGFSNVSMDDLTTALIVFGKNANTAKGGSVDMATAFRKVGISMAEMRDLSPDELLMQLADNFAAMPNSINKAGLASEVFGKSLGPKLVPFLNAGSAGIGQFRQKAQEMGLVIDAAGIKAGAAAAVSFGVLKGALTGLANQAVVPLIPVIVELVTALSNWLHENQADLILIIGTAVKFLGFAFKSVLFVLRPLTNILAFLVRNFKLLAIILAGGLAAALVADASLFYALGASAIQAGIAMVAAAARSAIAWIAAAAPFLVILAVLGLIFLIVEDIMAGMEGKRSIFGIIFNWIDKIPKIIADWFVGAITAWKNQIVAFFDWLVEQLKTIPNKIKEAFFSGGLGDVISFINPSAGAAIKGIGQGAGATRVPLVPTIPTPQRGGVTIHAPLNITVGPGADASVVGPIRDAVDDWWATKLGELQGGNGVR